MRFNLFYHLSCGGIRLTRCGDVPARYSIRLRQRRDVLQGFMHVASAFVAPHHLIALLPQTPSSCAPLFTCIVKLPARLTRSRAESRSSAEI